MEINIPIKSLVGVALLICGLFYFCYPQSKHSSDLQSLQEPTAFKEESLGYDEYEKFREIYGD